MRGRAALVVIGSGPEGERGALGLRAALALAVAGLDVTVWLTGPGALYAEDLDARAWLGGDPRSDIDGLIDDLEARILVDGSSAAAGRGVAVHPRRPEILVAGAGELAAAVDGADLRLAF